MVYEVIVVVGVHTQLYKWEQRVWAKKWKLSWQGLILCALLENAAGGVGGGHSIHALKGDK